MKVVVGLLGKKGAGKGTVASVLAGEGYVELAFAGPLYREVSDAFGVSVSYLQDRDGKELPSSLLSLERCINPKFFGLATSILKERRESGDSAGFLFDEVRKDFWLSPRVALQLWGQEYRRAEDNFYWIKKLAERYEQVESDKVVISDIRDPLEAAWVKRRDSGKVVKIVRSDNPYEKGGTEKHVSEQSIDAIAHDYVIHNDAGIEALEAGAFQMLNWAEGEGK